MSIPYTLPRFAVLRPFQVIGYPTAPFTDGYGRPTFHSIEAPSFYHGIRLRHSCSGTQTIIVGEEIVGILTYNFDVDHEWTREDMHHDSSNPSDDMCEMTMKLGSMDFSRPTFAIRLGANTAAEEIVIGTFNGEDIVDTPELMAPEFIYAWPYGRVAIPNRWGPLYGGNGASVAIDSSFPWRDLRDLWTGSFGPVEVDPPSTNTIKHEYEWELF